MHAGMMDVEIDVFHGRECAEGFGETTRRKNDTRFGLPGSGFSLPGGGGSDHHETFPFIASVFYCVTSGQPLFVGSMKASLPGMVASTL